MNPITFDIEANGLLEDADVVWVIAWKHFTEDEVRHKEIPSRDWLYGFFSVPHTVYIGHNILGFDLPVMELIYGNTFDCNVVDTLVLSRLLDPDRAEGHSLDDLSGGQKQEFSDFTRLTEEMVNYCKQDVRANEYVLKRLLQRLPVGEFDPSLDDLARIERLSVRYRTRRFSPERFGRTDRQLDGGDQRVSGL